MLCAACSTLRGGYQGLERRTGARRHGPIARRGRGGGGRLRVLVTDGEDGPPAVDPSLDGLD